MNTYIKSLIIMSFLLTLSIPLLSQNIVNTLASGGSFVIKDGVPTTFLSLSQSTGYLTLSNSISLPVSTSSSLGIIFKGADRFIHDYKPATANGNNTFIGINAGNFAMTASSATQSSNNTAVGYSSLNSLTTGYENSAFGGYSLFSNSSGRSNSAYGYKALYSNTTGMESCAFGQEALYSNTASANSAFGFQALYSNTSGASNSAFGFQALYSNVTGTSNCAFGEEALYSNTSNYNSAFGNYALMTNTSGANNCAFGYEALKINSTGSGNTAFGTNALDQATGSNNTAFGTSAGHNVTTGTNNTLIGNGAQPSIATISNEITLGDNSITSLRCQVTTITALSDIRDKTNIRDLPVGIDFLMSIKPRLFNWDRRDWYKDGKSNGSKMQVTPTAGFIAQELDDAQFRANAEWLDLVLKTNPDKFEATPGNLFPVLVKTIQELKLENDSLKAELSSIRNSVAEQVREEIKNMLQKVVSSQEQNREAGKLAEVLNKTNLLPGKPTQSLSINAF